MKPQLRVEGMSIVVLGPFSPPAFAPGWLASHGLLSEEAAEHADVKVITPDVAQFQTDQVIFQATTDRLDISTTDQPFEAVRDLVVGALAIAGMTPVRAMGINLRRHYQVESDDTWHEIGHIAVPKEDLWSKVLDEPGTKRVDVQGKRPDGRDGYIQISLQPSARIHPGVYIGVNDHFELDADDPHAIEDLDKLLMEDFDGSLGRGDKMIETMIEVFG